MEAQGGATLRHAKTHLSREGLACVIVDYLVLRKESTKPGCTAYDIAKNAPRLRTTQRQQRIEEILRDLETQGIVHCERYEKASYFSITDDGMKWYKDIVKRFYDVLGPIYPGFQD
jgi:DNA-binding PadR family transcriptional regulator